MKFQQLAEQVTKEVIREMEKGNVIWQKPWFVMNAAQNFVTKRAYEGFNQFYLNWIIQQRKYNYPYFLTFKQANNLGGYIKKGEKSTPVIYWKITQKKEQKGDTPEGQEGKVKTYFYPFIHHVFNLEQIEGIEVPEIASNNNNTFNTLDACEKIVSEMPVRPQILHGGNRAFYSRATDSITMPKANNFKTAEGYYSTLFHEMIHSTGHKNRLNRFGQGEQAKRFGDEAYSKEELVAEMGAAFLTAEAGIKERVFNNSIAYLKHWIEALNNDKTMIISAANRAYKAAAFILDRNEDVKEEIGKEIAVKS